MQPIKLYDHPLSGHAHRVRLFLSLLGLPFESILVDLRAKAQRSPEFLALNPFGQIPVIDDNGRILADSNAILLYLALKYGQDWWPADPWDAARVQRWLSVAAGPLASGPVTARRILVFGQAQDPAPAIAQAHALLQVMEAELQGRDFLVERPTLADIACYTYVAHAPEGNVDLQPYPAVRAWLARVEALPGFVPMQSSATGLRA